MPLIQAKEWTLGPRLEFAEQHWSIYQNLGTQTQFTNFQARTLGFGLQSFYILDETWTVSYSLSYNLGNGSQDQNTSTSNSAQNLKFTQVSQRGFSHQLAFEKRLSTRLSLLTGLQFDQFRQSWDSSRGQLTEETVAPGNKLTLTSGVAKDIRQPLRDHDGYKSYSLRLGLSLLMN
ncbi:MAG: hypothetical protein NTX25_00595 [Proteobacteria bacterium]|nr:hypothetical protein [Pseudomonadota bacterium]